MSLNFYKADVEIEFDDKPVSFTIYHNLEKSFGTSIEDAIDSWLIRTKTYTARSLCSYIMKKNLSFVAMPEKQWKRLNQQ